MCFSAALFLIKSMESHWEDAGRRSLTLQKYVRFSHCPLSQTREAEGRLKYVPSDSMKFHDSFAKEPGYIPYRQNLKKRGFELARNIGQLIEIEK